MIHPMRPASARFTLGMTAAAVALPLGADLATRGAHLLSFTWRELLVYAVALGASALLWAMLVQLAADYTSRLRFFWQLMLSGLILLLLVGQIRVYRLYAVYANSDALRAAIRIGSLLVAQGIRDWWAIVGTAIPLLAYAAFLVAVARRWSGSPWLSRLRAPLWLITLLLLASCPERVFGARQSAPADVIGLSALGRVVVTDFLHKRQTNGLARDPEFVPPQARPTNARRVVVILTESVRADVVCSEPRQECPVTSTTNRLLPNRIGLTELHAVDSNTLLSFAVLFGGRRPSQALTAMRRAPLIWDVAHAAGWKTGYLTSQNLDYSFLASFVRQFPLDFRCEARDLVADSDMGLGAPDELLVPHVQSMLTSVDQAFVLVIHLSNTHLPYRTAPGHSPFQPARYTQDPAHTVELVNQYKNSVYLQDHTIADLVTAIRSSRAGEQAIILFTSDHGEAFREHGQLAHTSSLYEEEIHVPGWIDIPPQLLDESAVDRLRHNARLTTFHSDLVPTLLDLMGILERPELALLRQELTGSSLLRPMDEGRQLRMTTCAEDWACPFRVLGVMQGSRKLIRTPGVPDRCFNLASDPTEQLGMPLDDCADLKASLTP